MEDRDTKVAQRLVTIFKRRPLTTRVFKKFHNKYGNAGIVKFAEMAQQHYIDVIRINALITATFKEDVRRQFLLATPTPPATSRKQHALACVA